MNALVGVVCRDCTVTIHGRRYWSPELAERIGWEIQIEIDRADEAYASAWTRGRNHRLCTVALIDAQAGTTIDERRALAQAEADERASVVSRQAQMLLDLIDQRIEHSARRNFSSQGKIQVSLRRCENALRAAWRNFFKGADAGDGERSDEVEAHLKMAHSILEDADALVSFDRHESLQDLGFIDRTAARLAAHRLSEGSK